MNPIMLHELGRARRRELLQQARHAHALAEAEAGRPGVAARVLDRFGLLLIRVGRRLQRPAEHHRAPRLAAWELGRPHTRP